ncbi:MAG: family 10 glycosylhydrolase [Clostridia bacterium]|nr:family 10 glycosylhydrolase [Clostridia bacterium]
MIKKKRAFILFLLLLAVILSACSPVNVITAETDTDKKDEVPLPETKEELFGIWIATAMNINFPSRSGLGEDQLKKELDEIVDTASEIGANALFFQVRPSGDAFYDSDIFPVSKYLTGEEGSELPNGFDPLSYLTEKAHQMGIAIHAWVNPMRASIGVTDTEKLSPNHPARLNPEYVIKYADGRLYFDPGLPAVRELIARGVAEIAEKYPVDGIIFDDYFYPYPIYTENSFGENTLAVFADSNSYSAFGGSFRSVGDYRRDSVNQMVKACYDAVKGVREDCLFGVAPFGIWKNNDGSNGGSNTRGLSSYYDIYCDPIAWVDGGYIDYLAPQIYWETDNQRASFIELADWWSHALADSGTDLYISYGVYRYEDDWPSPSGEITSQIYLAREKENYHGGICYGYPQIKNNINGLADELKILFSKEN